MITLSLLPSTIKTNSYIIFLLITNLCLAPLKNIYKENLKKKKTFKNAIFDNL